MRARARLGIPLAAIMALLALTTMSGPGRDDTLLGQLVSSSMPVVDQHHQGGAELLVTIADLPSALDARVVVSRQDAAHGWRRDIHHTTLFKNLLPGRYVVSASPVPAPRRGGRAAITYAATVAGSPATVLSHHRSSVTVDYGTGVPDTTIALDTRSTALLTAVSPDQEDLTFAGSTPQIARLAPGDVIAMGVTPLTPEGLARKVLAVTRESSAVTVRTAQARLTDLFEQLDLATSLPVVNASSSPPPARLAASLAQEIAFQPKQLCAQGKAALTLAANGSIGGALNLRINFSLLGGLREFSFVPDITESLDITATADADLACKGEYKTPTVKIGAPIVLDVAGVPLVIQVSLGGKAQWELSAGPAVQVMGIHESAAARVGYSTVSGWTSSFKGELAPLATRGDVQSSFRVEFAAALTTKVDGAINGPEINIGPRANLLGHVVAPRPSDRDYFELMGDLPVTVTIEQDLLSYKISATKEFVPFEKVFYQSVHDLSARDRSGRTISGAIVAAVGTPLAGSFAGVGGVVPVRWSVAGAAGALPSWLRVGADGVMSGTPSVAGTWLVRVTETDAGVSVAGTTVIPPTTASKVFTLQVQGGPAPSPTPTPSPTTPPPGLSFYHLGSPAVDPLLSTYPANGHTRFTLTVTVLDPQGRPTAGVPVGFSIDDHSGQGGFRAHAGSCGHLDAGTVVSDASGAATVGVTPGTIPAICRFNASLGGVVQLGWELPQTASPKVTTKVTISASQETASAASPGVITISVQVSDADTGTPMQDDEVELIAATRADDLTGSCGTFVTGGQQIGRTAYAYTDQSGRLSMSYLTPSSPGTCVVSADDAAGFGYYHAIDLITT